MCKLCGLAGPLWWSRWCSVTEATATGQCRWSHLAVDCGPPWHAPDNGTRRQYVQVEWGSDWWGSNRQVGGWGRRDNGARGRANWLDKDGQSPCVDALSMTWNKAMTESLRDHNNHTHTHTHTHRTHCSTDYDVLPFDLITLFVLFHQTVAAKKNRHIQTHIHSRIQIYVHTICVYTNSMYIHAYDRLYGGNWTV